MGLHCRATPIDKTHSSSNPSMGQLSSQSFHRNSQMIKKEEGSVCSGAPTAIPNLKIIAFHDITDYTGTSEEQAVRAVQASGFVATL